MPSQQIKPVSLIIVVQKTDILIKKVSYRRETHAMLCIS